MNQVKASGFTKQMARNMFYGGSVFFIFVFAALIFDSERKIPFRSNAEAITPAVVRGKGLWETRNCIGCHTLLGEGAYFAPELGNVYKRRGGEFIKAWI
jgi:nitric oxide reductase subunit C